ncbi:unnamed protein product, partial [Cuscuta epithymum]
MGKQREVWQHKLQTAKEPVWAVLNVAETNFQDIKLSVYHLQRSDGTEFTCKENDLYMLKMDDIYQMYLAFQEIPGIRDKTAQNGLDALKRFMIRQIKFFASHDLQMALETNMPKTNLTRPKLYRQELEDFPETLKIVKEKLQPIREAFKERQQKYADATNAELKEAHRIDNILQAIERQLDRRNS